MVASLRLSEGEGGTGSTECLLPRRMLEVEVRLHDFLCLEVDTCSKQHKCEQKTAVEYKQKKRSHLLPVSWPCSCSILIDPPYSRTAVA